MADVKISALPAATSYAATMEFPVNNSGTTEKVTGAQIQAGIAGGSDTQIQFNSSGALEGSSNLRWDDVNFAVLLGPDTGGQECRIFTTNAAGPDQSANPLVLNAGNPSGTGDGGGISFGASSADTEGSGGGFNLGAGSGKGAGNGGGGNLAAGNADATGDGGSINITAGASGQTDGTAGPILLTAGNAPDSNVNGGGVVVLKCGNGGNAGGHGADPNGSSLQIFCGDANTDSSLEGGCVYIRTGAGDSGAEDGNILLDGPGMFEANGSTVVALGAFGPTGTSATPKRWLKLFDVANAEFVYIPVF